MYDLEIEEVAAEQIAALPSEVLPALAELIDLITLQPWSGDPYVKHNPYGPIRAQAVGDHNQALVIYQIDDDQHRVVILRVLWAPLTAVAPASHAGERSDRQVAAWRTALGLGLRRAPGWNAVRERGGAPMPAAPGDFHQALHTCASVVLVEAGWPVLVGGGGCDGGERAAVGGRVCCGDGGSAG